MITLPRAFRRGILVPCLLALGACGRRDGDIRSYKEVHYEAEAPAKAKPPHAHGGAGGTMPPMAGGGMGAMTGAVPTASLKLAWAAPEGWAEQPARSMRLATFKAGEAECAVSAFPGDTGGEEANLKRWLGQLGAEASADALAKLSSAAVPFKTEGGWEGKLFDLAVALPEGAASGMRAAIIPVAGQTVFVKLTGPTAALDSQKAALEAFCRSLKPKS